ncbi:hypothetical protein ACHAW6_015662 [Cyclotella cf. meneghiniana]
MRCMLLSTLLSLGQLLALTTSGGGFMLPCVSNRIMRTRTARVADFSSVRTKLRSTAAPIQLPPVDHPTADSSRSLGKLQSFVVKSLMISYILSMCVALPVSLFPVYLLHKARFITKSQKEKISLQVGQFCSRWMMRLFPFARKRVIVDKDDENYKNPQPSIWVCNHISLLDIFFVLALDQKMRGKKRRPIKILYWKGLESNPITRLLFKMCGFIPVDMAANEHGAANEYDPKSFKQMLKSSKEAIKEGFDIGLLPEGQPNPTPEKGLQPIFTGAFTLAKMSRRPIQMIALYGLHNMWHPDTSIGMHCTARDMAVRVYPNGRLYDAAEEFAATFEAIVGYFGAHGEDIPDNELNMWLDGTMWKTELSRRAATRMELEDVDPAIEGAAAPKRNEETEELSEI